MPTIISTENVFFEKEEVVISGISGAFPSSNNTYEFRDNLMNQVDMVTDNNRWTMNHPGIPNRSGKINNIDKFDANFFGFSTEQADSIDPLGRILLEKTYEAIVDAGYNPAELYETNTGIFIGAALFDSEKIWLYHSSDLNKFGMLGNNRALLANRISYWLGVKGPSLVFDAACSSASYALEQAYQALKNNVCDFAIVCGANLSLLPYATLQFSRLGMLNMKGMCRSFDKNGNGYVRSDTIASLFLQKAKDSRRIYATVCHVKTNNDGYTEEGITYPSIEGQQQLMEHFYKECPISPYKLAYLEAHGTGTKIGDSVEAAVIDAFFCKNRKTPLKIGAVKSNAGHSEPASALCSIAKVIISFETGVIPPNLHYAIPRAEISGLIKGRMEIITELTKLDGSYVAINSFGFGGSNAHILLQKNEKEKLNSGMPADNIPRLICVSGRTEKSVQVMLEDIESRPLDAEFVRLLQELHKNDIKGHQYRGFTILQKNEPRCISKNIVRISSTQRPICFIFSGLGTQWIGMGSTLMNIPIFFRAIEKFSKILKPLGVDIIKVVTSNDPKTFDNIVHTFVGITAIQIGLVDILDQLQIHPDHIIGHSIGELCCAYADKCLTAEQVILIAYYQAVVSIESKLIKGAMLAVGIGYEKIKDLLPSEIDVACHNSPNSTILSGPIDIINKFTKFLTFNSVFTEELKTSCFAYHSRYCIEIKHRLLSEVSKIVPAPKERSSKWICSWAPKSLWDSSCVKFSSAEYFTNILLYPTLFDKSSQEIPSNAIAIEIAPHGILQDILKWSLPRTCVNVALSSQNKNNVNVLLNSIGKLYQEGVKLNIIDFYPKIAFPVSRGTPMISPLVRWDHSKNWFVPSMNNKFQEKYEAGERNVQLSNQNKEYAYINGHIIDGRNLFPAMGYLELIWEMFSKIKGECMHSMSIIFENVSFLRATNIPKDGSKVDFTLTIHRGSGNFEIIESQTAIVTGCIKMISNVDTEWIDKRKIISAPDHGDLISLNEKDIYRELNLRGYNYNGLFRSIVNVDSSRKVAKIKWFKNYVSFMDCMLQLYILQDVSRDLAVPTRIERIMICPRIHQDLIIQAENSDDQYLPVYIYENMDVIRGGGVEIRGLKVDTIQRRKILNEVVLERQSFIPYHHPDTLNLNNALRILAQLALENKPTIKVKTVEIDSYLKDPLMPILYSVLEHIPLIKSEAIIISNRQLEVSPSIKIQSYLTRTESNATFVINTNLIERPNALVETQKFINNDGFIISRENHIDIKKEPDNFTILSRIFTKEEQLILLKPKTNEPSKKYTIIEITSDTQFSWLHNVQNLMKNYENLILYCYNDPSNGLIGFVNCLRKELGGETVVAVFIADSKAPKFDPNLPFYKEQLDKKLVINVYINGQWGSFRHLQLESDSIITNHAYVDIKTKGDLSTLYWYESSSRFVDNDKIVNIYYSALNFRDVMITSGKIGNKYIKQMYPPNKSMHGLEFSGRDQKGNRVMGFVPCGALATKIKYDPGLIWTIPDDWSLEDAATVPIVYATVYYSLFYKGKIKRGETVLIHAGSGGVGQAAINLALFHGCVVFTTVGTAEKRDFIKQQFPQIPDTHIGNSRDTSFEQMVLKETKGRGVDLILNSLSDEKLQASLRCLAHGGRFLEIGKYDLSKNSNIGMRVFLRETSFYGIMLDILFYASSKEKQVIVNYLKQGIIDGAVKPLKRTIFEKNEIEKAFRYMAAGNHIGKVLIKIRDEEEQKIICAKEQTILAFPKFFCSNEKSCIIVGGLGGFGLELADWLIQRGLRKLVLSSRNGIKKGYQSLVVSKWRSHGIDVKISTANVATVKGCTDLISTAQKLGPVFAIFNLSVVLRDALLENQTVENFMTSFEGKVLGSKNLDELSRTMCPDLEYFVVFSSVSCGRGNAGQTNYGMANSVMERICEKRKSEGLPALAIQWGAVGDVGLVADMLEDAKVLEIGGTLRQNINSCIEQLDIFLRQDFPVVSSMVVADKKKRPTNNNTAVEAIANVLAIKDLKTININSSLSELGMDSIMAVEIKQTLEREFEVFLSAEDIRALTFARLRTIKNDKSIEKTDNDLQIINMGLLTRLLGDENTSDAVYTPTTITSCTLNQSPIFFIPGVEGKSSIFEYIFQNLNHQALCLQLQSEDCPITIVAIAESFIPILKSSIGDKKNFNIVAYSFGTVLAIELILRLESLGYTGKAIFVDGSPSLVIAIARNQFDCSNDSTLETSILYHILYTISSINLIEFKNELEKCDSWNSKVTLLISRIPTNSKYSTTYIRCLCENTLTRLRALLQHSPDISRKIKSPLHLVRIMNPTVANVAEDYELSMLTESPCAVSKIDGNHYSILENPALGIIINEFFAS